MQKPPPKQAPAWLKALRVFLIICAPIMVLNCAMAWQEDTEHFADLAPVTAILFACTHLVVRAPYKKWRVWEWPLVATSAGVAAFAAFHFVPDGEEHEFGFQLFVASFAGLSLIYGFFCTAISEAHPMREGVIAPTKRVSQFGLGINLGLVLAPFAFVVYLVKFHLRSKSSAAEKQNVCGQNRSTET